MRNKVISIQNYQLELTYDDTLVWHCPPSIKGEYEQALKQWSSRILFNSVRAKPYSFSMNEQTQIVHILAGPFSYAQTRALQECMQNPANKDVIELQDEISSISLTVAVASSDNEILIGKRSHKVSRYANCWSVGLGEGLEEKDFKDGNIVNSVHRALVEELNFEHDDFPSIDCLSISFSEDSCSMNILALADLRHSDDSRHTSDAIIHRAQYAHDAWEHSQLAFIKPETNSLKSLVHHDMMAPNSILYFSHLIEKMQHSDHLD
jgi:hypothetical protein